MIPSPRLKAGEFTSHWCESSSPKAREAGVLEKCPNPSRQEFTLCVFACSKPMSHWLVFPMLKAELSPLTCLSPETASGHAEIMHGQVVFNPVRVTAKISHHNEPAMTSESGPASVWPLPSGGWDQSHASATPGHSQTLDKCHRGERGVYGALRGPELA